ncbi:MAG: hypothetical protein GY943_17665 [Chloroflexi bacterium]|nr:hypothetical protein [Chloroflexota bacterium]
MFDLPPKYKTYILRVWEERSPTKSDAATWRFSLENPETNIRHGFSDFQAFIAFLEAEMRSDTAVS